MSLIDLIAQIAKSPAPSIEKLQCLQRIQRVMADMPKPVIVKIQRPLTGGPDAPWYVYDQSRAINEFIAADELPSSVVKAMGTGAKLYVHCVRDADGRLIFGSPAAAQSW